MERSSPWMGRRASDSGGKKIENGAERAIHKSDPGPRITTEKVLGQKNQSATKGNPPSGTAGVELMKIN